MSDRMTTLERNVINVNQRRLHVRGRIDMRTCLDEFLILDPPGR